MACNCASDWRLEYLDLGSGNRLGWLPFVGFEVQETLNDVGTGTVSLNPNDVPIGNVWPHLRAIAFTRIAGTDASPSNPVCEFIGMVEAVTPDSDGNMSVGVVSIEGYLNHRIIETDTTYTSKQQTEVCADLVGLADGGVNLSATFDGSGINLTRTYAAADDSFIYPSIADILASENGCDYDLHHSFLGGTWSTVMRFGDGLGADRGSLNARRGLVAYSMNVDAANHCNWMRGRSATGVYTGNNLSDTIYPRFDRAQQWSDLSETGTPILQRNVAGQLAENADPDILPDITVANLDIAANLKPGDRTLLNMNMGALRYQGYARVQSRSWSISAEQPTLCTLSMKRYDSSASELVLNAPAETQARGCC